MTYIKEGATPNLGDFAKVVRLADQIEALKTTCPLDFIYYRIADSVQMSERSYTIYSQDSRPIGMFGLTRTEGDVGIPWLVCSEEVLTFSMRKKLIPMGRRFLKKVLLTRYSRLVNCVDPENKKAIRFIKYMGFRFTGETFKTLAGYDFLIFEMRREDV